MNKLIIIALMLMPLQSLAVISAEVKIKSTFTPAENRKMENDFFGFLVVTPNNEWEQEWNTSPDTVPYFKEVENVTIGQELSVLTLFANPKPDFSNNVNVICSIKVTRPNKTIAMNKKNISCLIGQLQGPAENVRLSPAILKFVAEKSDPIGLYLVEVTIEDKNRATKLELKTHYTFNGKNG